MSAEDFTGYRAIQAEGRRIGLMTCLRCGTAVIVGEDEPTGKMHDDWHAFLAANLELPDLVDDGGKGR